MMTIGTWLAPTRCLADVRYGDKAACLGDLAKRAAATLGLERAAILEALLHRESLGSTGLGNGIALPHARLAAIDAPFVLIARLRDPIAFEAVDGKPVDIVGLVLTPATAEAEKTKVLACLAKRLRDADALAAMRRAKTADDLFAAAVG